VQTILSLLVAVVVVQRKIHTQVIVVAELVV
jgi:hypothetical protein